MHLRSRMGFENNEILPEIFVILNNIAFTPWPSSTPPGILLRRFKGIERVFSRVAALLWSGPFYSTHGNSLDRSEGTKDSAWFPDGWASEPRRIKDLSAKDGSFDREEAVKYSSIAQTSIFKRRKIDTYMQHSESKIIFSINQIFQYFAHFSAQRFSNVLIKNNNKCLKKKIVKFRGNIYD